MEIRKAAILLALASSALSYGCSAAQRKEILDEALVNAKAYAVENGKALLAAAATQASEIADKKLKEIELKRYAELDANLANLATVTKDPDTGIETRAVKTWKDFDEDKNGSLNEGELVKSGTWVIAETARRVASGQMSKESAKTTATGAGAAILALLGIAVAKRGLSAVAKKPAPPAGGAPA